MKVRTLIEHLQQAEPEAEVIFNMDGTGRVYKGVRAVEGRQLAIDHGEAACYEPHGFREFEVITAPPGTVEIDEEVIQVFVLWP